jgi:hypothetical protein
MACGSLVGTLFLLQGTATPASLYLKQLKGGRQWIDSKVADKDLSKLNADAKSIVQFSEEYFELAALNSIRDIQILSMQQPGEELRVSIRGHVYRILPAK